MFYDAYCQRKPDIVSFTFRFKSNPSNSEGETDVETDESIISTYVASIHEVKIVQKPENKAYVKKRTHVALVQLGHSARLLSRIQPNRMHVLGTIFVNSGITLVAYDRSGAVVTKTYDVDKEPEMFLTIMLGFLYADDAELGFDPTIRLNEDMKTGEMLINDSGRWYPIVDVLHVEGSIHGRGTVCYKVTSPYDDEDWEEGVVKDCWSDVTRNESEGDILEKIEGIEGVPKVVSEWTVKDDKTGVHTTARFRRDIVEDDADDGKKPKSKGKWKLDRNNNVEIRVQRRMLIVPVGVPIQHFSSLPELLSVFRDVVQSKWLKCTIVIMMY